ncbi:hypothetical protein AYO22_00233 [Fonsecaea multimorphosa]|nr:hypothetical protein AYO22_00233 [Fonsecaea multimorphosa]
MSTDLVRYAQLRRQIQKWGLNGDTNEATFVDPPLPSTEAASSLNFEFDSSVEPHVIPGPVPDVALDSPLDPNLRASPDARMRPDRVLGGTKDQTTLAEQSPPSSGGMQLEQQAARSGPKSQVAGSLTRNSPEMSPLQRTSSPYMNSHDIISSPSGRTSVGSGRLERQSSQISSTPPLTLAETASTDDASITDRKLSEEASSLLVDRASPSQGSHYKVISPSSLLALWPAFEGPLSLSASEVREIQGVAATLAAGRLFDDAFDLFFVEYKYWQACTSKLSADEIYPLSATSIHSSVRCMVTAAINCARNSSPGARAEIAYETLLNVQPLLQAYGFAHNLDGALLNLYLSQLQYHSAFAELQDPKETALRLAVSCIGERFEVILPEIQDREYLWIISSLKRMLRDGLPSGTWHMASRCLEPHVAYHNHLFDCEEARMALRTILEWCKAFVKKHRHTLTRVGLRSPGSAWTRVSAVWAMYCSCVLAISSFDLLVQNTESIYQVPLCPHGVKPLKLDVLMALAAICQSFLSSGIEKSRRRLFGPLFGDYLETEINATLTAWPTQSSEIIRLYLLRMDDIPTAPEGTQVMSGVPWFLVEGYIVPAFRTRESSQKIDRTSFSGSALLAHSSIRSSGHSTSRNSFASSFQSSINSIRSSMSLDTKRTLAQMLETRDRLHRPWSVLSTLSKNTSSSAAISIGSQGSNNFERLTGMPSTSPDVDLAENANLWAPEDGDLMAIDPTFGETDDVEMANNPTTS